MKKRFKNLILMVLFVGWTVQLMASEHFDAPKKSQGNLKSDNNGVNDDIAREKFIKLAKNGDAEAQFQLGEIYYKGDGVKQNYEEAFKWLNLSAEQENANAQHILAEIYMLSRKYGKAFYLYKLSAEQGHAESQYIVGIMYRNGLHVEKNYKEAVKYLKLSAYQKNDKAQCFLGIMYRDGMGTKKDYNEAFKLLTLSANQKNSDGQCALAFMYYSGLGCEKNYKEAVKYFKLSAKQGNKIAISILSKIENK